MNKADKTLGFQTLMLSAMKLLDGLSLDNLSFHRSDCKMNPDLSCAQRTLLPQGQSLSLPLN